MSNSSASKRRELPADTQMDRLLTQFFHQEVPAELNAGFSIQADVASPMARSRVELTLLPETQPLASEVRRQPVAVRITVASSLAAVVALLLVVASSQLPRTSQSPNSIVSQKSTTTPTQNGQVDDGQLNRTGEDDLMLVSPRAGQANGRESSILGNDGVTLEEADSVDLHPDSSNAPGSAPKP